MKHMAGGDDKSYYVNIKPVLYTSVGIDPGQTHLSIRFISGRVKLMLLTDGSVEWDFSRAGSYRLPAEEVAGGCLEAPGDSVVQKASNNKWIGMLIYRKPSC